MTHKHPVLELDAVGFRYPARDDGDVLTGVSLRFHAGTLVCLVGPNGAGKSTLLRIAAGILAPLAGRATLDGNPVHDLPRRDLARALAYVPQEFSPAFPFRVAELVLMGRYPHRGFGRFESADDLALAQRAMEDADVWPLRERRFDTLSGGERRRVLLAQAFCQATPLLLLDEPTAALDPAHAIAVLTTLRKDSAGRGTTTVVVTHDLNLAARFADRGVVLAGGRAVADGPPREVLPGAAARAAFGVGMHAGALPSGLPFVVPE